MSKRGLIIGKFMPLHIGHESLFSFALNECKCSELTIIVLGHKDEPIDLNLRTKWVKNSDVLGCNVNVVSLEYDPRQLDSSSESNIISSYDWAEFLNCYIQKCDVIIGSEEYVRYMADYKCKEFILFDPSRTKVNISATEIRESPVKYWNYLASSVKQDLAVHFCICGTESSGKTTFCKKLEDSSDKVTMIPEIGRCLIGNAATCTKKDLMNVYNIHKNLLESVRKNPPTPIVLWDTDNITTLSYMNYLGFDIPIKNYEVPLADIYIFLDRSFEYQKDNTRLEEDQALALRKNHERFYTDIFNVENIEFRTMDDGLYKNFADCIAVIENDIKDALCLNLSKANYE